MGNDARCIIFGCTKTSFIGFLHIEVTVSLYIRICYEGGGMITNHGTRIVPSQFPHGQYAAFAMFLDERTDKSLVQFRVDNRHQRMIGTESVPQRENGVDWLVHPALMGFQIHSQITSVSISKQVGLHTRMVKCRIEHGTLVVVLRIDVNLGEISIPLLAGSTTYTVEIPSGNFGFHILAGTVHIYGRHTYLYQYLLIGLRLELQ